MSEAARGALPPKLYFRIGEVAELVLVGPEGTNEEVARAAAVPTFPTPRPKTQHTPEPPHAPAASPKQTRERQ